MKWLTLLLMVFSIVFLDDDIWISINNSFFENFPKGQISYIPALVQIMATIWTSDGKFTDAYMHHSPSLSQHTLVI